MISRQLFDKMLNKYGDVASWAVWDEQGEKPKSNMSWRNVFDLEKNTRLLDDLRDDVVMIGLNFSRQPNQAPFSNFHDENPHANDFKIRYAFRNTRFYGAYMTDVLKNLVILESGNVLGFIRQNPHVITSHINALAEELHDLSPKKPLLLAFGRDAFNLLDKHLNPNLYSVLIPITHYSHQMSKEVYSETVKRQIANVLPSL